METNKNFVVYKSSAGSGKTYTLVKEYLRLSIESANPSRYTNILAITFTNKAAKEMKERVLAGLRKLSLSGSKAEVDLPFLSDIEHATNLNPEIVADRANKILKDMLHNYSDIHISTIDKFVHSLIRTFSRDLKLTADFEIELDTYKLLKSTIDNLIGQAGESLEITEILLDFLNAQLGNETDWKIEKSIFDFSKNLITEDSFGYIEKLKKYSYKDYKKIQNKYVSENKIFQGKVTGFGKKAILLIESKNIEKDWFAGGEGRGISKFFIYLKDFNEEKLIPTQTVEKYVSEDNWVSKKCPAFGSDAIEKVKDELSSIFYEAYNYILENLPHYKETSNLKTNIFNLALITSIENELIKLKEDNNILPISEFNKIISNVVRNEPAPFIYERLGSKFKNYLIDEFQDTSITQWQNLLPLIDESLSNSNYNMIVGDAKQSIYRWRGGEVEQFSQLPDLYPKAKTILDKVREKTLHFNYSKINLEKNYRSKPAIVEFNNQLYENLKNLLTDNYLDVYKDSLQLKKENKIEGYVSFKEIKTNENDETELLYLNKILITIQECINHGYAYENIAIIIRKNVDGNTIANYLTEQKIPITSNESLLLRSNRKVDLIINIFNWIIDKGNQHTHLKIASYFHYSFNRHVNFTEFINSYSENKIINIQKIFIDCKIELDLSNYSKFNAYQLAEYLIRKFNFNSNQDAYLHFFIEELFKQTLKGNSSVSGFLDFWNDNLDKLSIKTSDSLNAVKILTIHKSKGLEFPVVILPFLNWTIKNEKKESWVDLDPNIYGLPASIIQLNKNKIEGTIFEKYYVVEKNKSLLDKLNLLYVSTTRAIDRLYGFYSLKNSTNGETIGKFINEALCSIEGNLNVESPFEFGNVEIINTISDTPQNINYLENDIFKIWNEKFRLNKAQEKIFGNEYEIQKEEGKEVHHLLSLIHYENDIDAIINNYFKNKGNFDTIVNFDKNKIISLLQDEKIRPFFSRRWKVYTEKEILLQNGNLIRLDRFLVDENIAIIIDFKTGRKKEDHKVQVTEYGHAIKKMGFKNVKMYLIYIETKEVVEVTGFFQEGLF